MSSYECLDELNDDSGETFVVLAINDGSLLEYIFVVGCTKWGSK